MRKTILACVVTALVAGAGTATAASLITGDQIKNGSLTSADVKNGSLYGKDLHKHSVGINKLSKSLQRKLRAISAQSGNPTPIAGGKGDTGAQGPKGDKGAKGDTGPQGPKGDRGEKGNGVLPDGFARTSNLVGETTHGMTFGPFVNAGTNGGSLRYDALDGKKLSSIEHLAYTVGYTDSDNSALGIPYLRIFLKDGNEDIVFDPTMCATESPSQNADHAYDVTTATKLRYSDDACGAHYDPQTWDEIVAAHGDETISGILVTTGFAGGKDVTAWLTELTVNDRTFDFVD